MLAGELACQIERNGTEPRRLSSMAALVLNQVAIVGFSPIVVLHCRCALVRSGWPARGGQTRLGSCVAELRPQLDLL